MSNPFKAVGKIFKSVAKVAKKILPVVAVAAAVLFVGGAVAGGLTKILGPTVVGGASSSSLALTGPLGAFGGGAAGAAGISTAAGAAAVAGGAGSSLVAGGGFFGSVFKTLTTSFAGMNPYVKGKMVEGLFVLGGGMLAGKGEEEREKLKYRDWNTYAGRGGKPQWQWGQNRPQTQTTGPRQTGAMITPQQQQTGIIPAQASQANLKVAARAQDPSLQLSRPARTVAARAGSGILQPHSPMQRFQNV